MPNGIINIIVIIIMEYDEKKKLDFSVLTVFVQESLVRLWKYEFGHDSTCMSITYSLVLKPSFTSNSIDVDSPILGW